MKLDIGGQVQRSGGPKTKNTLVRSKNSGFRPWATIWPVNYAPIFFTDSEVKLITHDFKNMKIQKFKIYF